jgi:hypothetical protein
MNHSKPPHLAVDYRRVLQIAALLLIPAYAPTHSKPSGPRSASESTPYLVALGASPLRFREEAPPPSFAKRPAAASPPMPADDIANAALALAGSNTTAAASIRPDVILPAQKTAAERDDGSAPFRANNSPPSPPAIIPDDSRPAVRPEDFLPFFQLPGSGSAPAEVRVIVPVPRSVPASAIPLPVSSATYNQTP